MNFQSHEKKKARMQFTLVKLSSEQQYLELKSGDFVG